MATDPTPRQASHRHVQQRQVPPGRPPSPRQPSPSRGPVLALALLLPATAPRRPAGRATRARRREPRGWRRPGARRPRPGQPGRRRASIGPAVMSGRVVDIAVAETPGMRGGRLGTVIYIAAATGGIWKSNQRRDRLGADLRRRGRGFDGRRDRRAVERQHRLGRDGRAQQPAQLVVRGRGLQVGGRRRDLRAHGAA